MLYCTVARFFVRVESSRPRAVIGKPSPSVIVFVAIDRVGTSRAILSSITMV